MINKFAVLIILAGCFWWSQNPVLAQWTPPPGNPPSGSAHLFINPMIEDLQLNGWGIFDSSGIFGLDPGSSTVLSVGANGPGWAGYFGKTYISELCLGGEGNCQSTWNADIFWQAAPNGIFYNPAGNDGHVGIGAVDPGYPLHVINDGPDINDTAIINIQDTTNNHYTGVRLEIGSGGAAAEKWFIGMANPTHELIFRGSSTGIPANNLIRLTTRGVLTLAGQESNLYMDGNGSLDGTTGNIYLQHNSTVDGVDISDYSLYFINDGGVAGQVWTSLGAGRGHWANPTGGGGAADGYIGVGAGPHLASANIGLNSHWLSNDGQNEGISVDNNGTVILSGNLVSPTGAFVAAAINATSGNLQTFSANSISTGSLTASTDAIITGRVGVGTASPAHQLHLYRTFGDNSELDIQSVAGAGNHWGIYQDRASADLYFWQGDNRVVFTNEGRVGIGTVSPAYTLDVNGTINAATNISAANANLTTQLRINRPANSDPIQLLGGTNPHTIRFDSQDLRFWTPNANEVMRLRQDTGNVGIGTASPGYRLDVSGSIHGTSYYSSDGSAGITDTLNVGSCTITVKNGLITATTCP